MLGDPGLSVLEVLFRRIRIYWGLFLGPPVSGNSHLEALEGLLDMISTETLESGGFQLQSIFLVSQKVLEYIYIEREREAGARIYSP